MKKIFLLMWGSLLVLLGQAQPGLTAKQKKGTDRPNIIVFLVDDMGWMDTSVPFGDSAGALNRTFHTPSMDRLAAAGMKFTNAYATPVCTPSRASLMSGMNAAHHGITNWTSPRKNNSTDHTDEQLLPSDWKINGLSPVPGLEHTTVATPFPQLLQGAGYYTIHVGKAHWAPAGTPGASPYHMGFMVNIAGHAAGHPQSYRGRDNYGNLPGRATPQAVPDLEAYYGTDTFLTEALTLEALRALEAPIQNHQPFFLQLAHYAVHDPLQGDPRFLQPYLDRGMDSAEARYATLIEGMDKSLGDVMAFLKKKGVEQQTILLFLSDNGGLSYTPPRGGAPHTHNLPLRAGKGSLYEGGIRVPLIVRWPGVVRPGSVTSQYVIVEDLFPTILEMARLGPYQTRQTVDGRSMVPLLKNPGWSDRQRCLIWHFPNKWQPEDGPGINYKSAIRQGDWKLVYDLRTGGCELYDLHSDIGELTNLAVTHPDQVKALSQLLSRQLRTWNAPLPHYKSSGAPVALPDEKNSGFHPLP